VIKDIIESLLDLEYSVTTTPWVLAAEQYGVPQMRRRVFLVATREKDNLPKPPYPLFAKCAGRRENASQRSLLETLPYPVTVGEAFKGLSTFESTPESKPEANGLRPSYSLWLKGLIKTDQMLKEMSGR